MAIEFGKIKPTCQMCGEEMICNICAYDDTDHLLPLTNGQRDVLRDILTHVKELSKNDEVEMSAVDLTDLDTLNDAVQNLYLPSKQK